MWAGGGRQHLHQVGCWAPGGLGLWAPQPQPFACNPSTTPTGVSYCCVYVRAAGGGKAAMHQRPMRPCDTSRRMCDGPDSPDGSLAGQGPLSSITNCRTRVRRSTMQGFGRAQTCTLHACNMQQLTAGMHLVRRGRGALHCKLDVPPHQHQSMGWHQCILTIHTCAPCAMHHQHARFGVTCLLYRSGRASAR